MHCGKCNLNKIGPRTVPFGGYICSNEHLQCSDCNMKSQGQCSICNNYTNFVEMKINPSSHHSGTMKSKIGDATEQPSGNAFAAGGHYFSKSSHDHAMSETGISQEQQTLSASADLFKPNDEEGDVKGTLHGKNEDEKAKVSFNPKDGEAEKIEQYLVNESDVKLKQSVDVFQESFNKTTKFQSNTEISRIPKLLRPTSLATLGPNHNKSEECKIAKGTDVDHKELPQPSNTEKSRIPELFRATSPATLGPNHNKSEECKIAKGTDVDHKELPQPVQSSIKLKESKLGKVTDEHQKQIPHRIESAVHCRHDSACEGTQSNENVFLFDEDLSDARTMTNSKVHCMDSMGSLTNFYPGDKSSIGEFVSKSISNSNLQQLDGLSVEMLEFAAHNAINQNEIVEHHWQSYGQLPFTCTSSYCPQAKCDLNLSLQLPNKKTQSTCSAQKESACVSTDSEPALKLYGAPAAPQIEVALPTAFKKQDFLVMHTIGIPKPNSDVMEQKDKIERPVLDLRMQKILETFQENPRIKFKGNTDINSEHAKGDFIKMRTCGLTFDSTKQRTIKSIIKMPATRIDSGEKQICKLTEFAGQTNLTGKRSLIIKHLLNVHRAFYNPPLNLPAPVWPLRLLPNAKPIAQEPPPDQFKIVSCSSAVLENLLMAKGHVISVKPVSAHAINISRTPVQCPETNCQRMIFVSDFNKHFAVDHNHLPIERIAPFQSKSFFLDPRLAHCDIAKCHLLYLMRDKITDLGSTQYKDFLPILVMSSRINLAQMCSLNERDHHDLFADGKSKEFIIIWITGIVPEQFPISVSLTVWAHTGQVPHCHMVYSGEMYSVRKSQRGIDVWRSGHTLLLTPIEINLLTNGGEEMLNLQLSVH
uniref:DUF4729 domain-containing protein n=1 Tax=Glossina pallidipes TaxID=7398 RepID=A0A1B0AI70_GLOPL